MDAIKKLTKAPLLIIHVSVVGAICVCVWSFFAYCNARELLDLGLSLSRRRGGVSAPVNNQHQAEFNPVNRDKLHLQVVAFSLAKKHGQKMEASVRDLYKQSKKLSQKKERASIKKNSAHIKSSKKQVAHKIVTTSCIKPKPMSKQNKKVIHALAASAVWDPRFALPIEPGKFRITSSFGWRKIKGRREFHGGIDMAAPKGTPVCAAGDGTVVHAGFIRGFGNLVVIEHDGRIYTFYGHLSAITTRLGREVDEGTMIGRVGATGRAFGTHLHFSVKKKGRWVDPRLFLKH